MSLINEALKKADREAEANSPHRVAPFRTTPRHTPRRSGARWTIVLLGTLALAVSAVFFLRLFSPSATTGVDGGAAVRTALETTLDAASPPIPDGTAEPEPDDETDTTGASPSPVSPASRTDEARSARNRTNRRARPFVDEDEVPFTSVPLADGDATETVAEAAPIEAPSAREPETPFTPIATPSASPAAPAVPPTTPVQSFVKTAPLPGGGELVLSGIAWSETRPVAVISGTVLAPGEGVRGYSVVEIREDEVELQGPDDGVLILRLR